MHYEILSEGFVARLHANEPNAVAAGSRTALAANGEIVCTYMVQPALGVNGFDTIIARSKDGENWYGHRTMWPQYKNKESVFGSISRAPNCELYFFGSTTHIDEVGETFWCDETQGMKENHMFWSCSADNGHTWSDPVFMPSPFTCSVEAAGPITVTGKGRMIACFIPYNTFDPNINVEGNQVMAMISDDGGRNWKFDKMISFGPDALGAESWVIELADGRLLATCWRAARPEVDDFPNAYTLSNDGGDTWGPTLSTGIMGQSTALAALPDGRALFIYNQRKHGEIGVWLAVANPTENDFGIQHNAPIWRAQSKTQSGESSANLDSWTDFSFGEPSIMPLPDGALLATLWCVEAAGSGIRYVKLKIVE